MEFRFNREELEGLTRREYQQLAKAHGIKANIKTVEIIEQLLEIIIEAPTAEESEILSETGLHEDVIPKDIDLGAYADDGPDDECECGDDDVLNMSTKMDSMAIETEDEKEELPSTEDELVSTYTPWIQSSPYHPHQKVFCPITNCEINIDKKLVLLHLSGKRFQTLKTQSENLE